VPLYLKFFVIFLFIIPAAYSQSSDRVVYADAVTTIGQQCNYFLDGSGELTIDSLLQSDGHHRFEPYPHATINFGPTTSACWIQFEYTTRDTLKHYLQISNSNLNEIDFYIVDHGGIISSQQAGLKRKKNGNELKFNVWLFELLNPPADKTYTCFVRVSDPRRVIIPVTTTDLNTVIQSGHQTDFLYGIYFGALTIIVIINIVIFFYFREIIYILYSLHTTAQILINGILKGYLFTLFGSGLYFLSPFVPALASISNIFFILFTIAFLELKTRDPILYRISLGLLVLPILNVLIGFVGFYAFSAVAGAYIGLVVCIWLFYVGLKMYMRKVTQARFFVIGWGVFLVSIIILNFALNRWIPLTPLNYNAALYGTLVEVLLITAALADRINLFRINHERERQEKILLIEQQKTWLEENVKLRTYELVSKNNEIESQNEELKQQHEELSATHELVEKQKRLVEEQNKKIETVNQELEQKVQERTMQLEGTVKSLIRQNHDLEQFSYIVSHNMRAPVARIMGLLNLLEFDQNSEDERKVLMEHLKESAQNVDQIIHDLSQIIAIRKGLDTVVENVDIKHVIRHITSDLTDEIKRANSTIDLDIQVDEMVSVKSYVQSILYNLLSNAIKYRNPERPSRISLSVTNQNNDIRFDVSDNGLGIDLPKERMGEIFNLYKRIHTHVQGKGLGLYLVKTQVEGLHGHISVSTRLGEGTSFAVTLPKINR
jgi:two-component system, sensor histidine kinase LadS